MTNFVRLRGFGAVFVVSACALSGQATAQEVVFRFAPPDGTRMVTVFSMQRERTVAGQPTVRDEAESTTEGTFRYVDKTLHLQQRIVSSAARRNGVAIKDPVMEALQQIQPKMTIGTDGLLKDVSGFGEVAKLLEQRLPAAQVQALAPVLGEEAIVAREKAEWSARYADFVGAKVRIGDKVDAQALQPLPNGKDLAYTVRTTFAGFEPCAAGSCVRIEQEHESDAKELAKWTGQLASTLGGDAAMAQPQAAEARISGKLIRLVDPKTLLIYSERVERKLEMTLTGPQGPTPVQQTETRTYTYTYSRP